MFSSDATLLGSPVSIITCGATLRHVWCSQWSHSAACVGVYVLVQLFTFIEVFQFNRFVTNADVRLLRSD